MQRKINAGYLNLDALINRSSCISVSTDTSDGGNSVDLGGLSGALSVNQ
jgi:hypothetical protein